MFITTENEIISLMPTARWKEPRKMFGYLEEEERVALEPLLGTPLFEHLLQEYGRLRETYVDITATTIRPTGKAKSEPALPYADVTETLDAIQAGMRPYASPCVPTVEEEDEVPAADMKTIRLIRICQQIEFYKMLSHKAGLLTVSFNEGGGMNVVSADNYDSASDKDREEARKDAFMSAGRAIDSLLLFLEADAKGEKLFTELWKKADAFYLHKDLLFQTARVLNEYLPIKGERMVYIDLVRDIRFCQNTYLKPRVGKGLLAAVLAYANGETHHQPLPDMEGSDYQQGAEVTTPLAPREGQGESLVLDELLTLLRTALAFYVESRRVEIVPQKEKLARRDSMTDAQQAMAMVCAYIEENIDALGNAAVGTPIYNAIREKEAQEQRDRENAQAAECRRRRAACEQNSRKLFTGFPATHRTPEHK